MTPLFFIFPLSFFSSNSNLKNKALRFPGIQKCMRPCAYWFFYQVFNQFCSFFRMFWADNFSRWKQVFIVTDLTSTDKHGQSIMHEVAREWDTGLAHWLFSQGAPIDVEDNWGRTPLFVAASSNHVPMVKWLIKNGGKNNMSISNSTESVYTLFYKKVSWVSSTRLS